MGIREESDRVAKELGAKIRSARKRRGLTQEQLVDLAEVSEITLSKLERGASKPTFDVLVRLSLALSVSPNELLGWRDAAIDGEDAKRVELIDALRRESERLPLKWLETIVTLASIRPK